MEISNEILNIVLALTLVLVTNYLLPYLKSLLAKSKHEYLVKLIEEFVKSAEQIYQGTKMGEQKKLYVTKRLTDKGIALDDEVNAMIESNVYKLKEV